MRNKLSPYLLLCCVGVSYTAVTAQENDKWPPTPQFDLNDNYTAAEKKFVIKEVAPYYQFAPRTSSWPVQPDPKLITPNIGPKAFELMDEVAAKKGTFVLSPYYYNAQSERHPILNLKHLKGKTYSDSYFYCNPVSDTIHSPLISPDGRTVILRDGLPPDDRYNIFNLFLWDIEKGRLRVGPYQPLLGTLYPGRPSIMDELSGISLPVLHWSPGSRFVSYLRGGNTFGDYDPRSSSYDLFVLDTPSRRDRLVAKNAGLHWSWTYDGRLLFSRIAPAQAGDVALRSARPSVYLANADAAKAPKPASATALLATSPLAQRKLFDGGYYAQASPDGQWIAFCDWPGTLLEDAPDIAPEVKNNAQRGLFLWHVPTKQRIFVGALTLEESDYPADAPLLQWSPDGKNLYVLERLAEGDSRKVIGVVSKMELEQQTLQPLARLEMNPERGGYFRARGISPDGARLYYEFRENLIGQPNLPAQQFTLWSVNTGDGETAPLARLKNVAWENPDWDWLDQSGPNAAFVQAQKRERALPVWKDIAQ